MLIRRWDVLTDAEREATELLRGGIQADSAATALNAAGASVAGRERAAVLEYLASVPDRWRLSPELVIASLADPDEMVAKSAERVIRGMADAEDAGAMAVLGVAADSYEVHQSRAVVSATLASGRRGAEHAWQSLEGQDEGRRAMVRAMRADADEIVRERAWEELATGWLATPSVDRLRGACTTREHEMVLERGPLVLRPARRAAIESLSARERKTFLAGILPVNAAVLCKLGPEAWCGLVRVARWLGAEPARRDSLSRACLGHPSAAVRLASWMNGPLRSAIDSAFDADSRIAKSAVLAASGDLGIVREMTLLTRSAHREVRAIAGEECKRMGEVWDESGLSMTGLRERHRRDTAAFIRSWREEFEASDASAKSAMARIAARLGILGEVGRSILDAVRWDTEAGTADAMFAATVAKVLGGVDAEAGERGLSSGDARVCANAAEAVRGSLAERVARLRGHDHHRVRSTVARRLAMEGKLTAREIRVEAEGMLGDRRAGHRLAGAWLTERAVMGDERGRMAAVLEQRGNQDESVAVRARVRACVARWVAEMDTQGVAA